MSAHDTSIPRDATGVDRREFLRLSSAVAAASALASTACQVPPENAVPLHDMPETLVDGLGPARYFHTVLDGVPVRVRTREGRPILVTAAPGDPSSRGVTLRHQASLMDLYDPDRARGPRRLARNPETSVSASWSSVSADVVAKVKAAGSKSVLLTGPVTSPALASVIDGLKTRTGLQHVVWTPLAGDAAAAATAEAFGQAVGWRPRLDLADVVVGFGAEYLDRGADGLERDFARRRAPEAAGGRRMNRIIQFEGRLTLTGANADRRIRVRDSKLALVGAALAHELIVGRGLGPFANDAAVREALAPYAIDAVAGTAGVDAGALKAVAAELANANGRAVVIAGGAASAGAAGPAIELTALLLNVTLGAYDAGVIEDLGPAATPAGPSALERLTADMAAGRVDLLIVAGANPAYDAPNGIAFVDALAKVGTVVSLNDRVDETGRHADYLAPASHSFEAWGDAALPRGLFGVQQPVVQPLFDTRGLLDILVDWAAALGDPASLAALAAATAKVPAPAPNSAERARSTSLAYFYLRQAWAARLGTEATSTAAETAWNGVLRTGWWQGPAPAPASRTLVAAALAHLAGLATATGPTGVELQLYPHAAHIDGRAGNNGWLHELPDPVTRLTWGGALSMAPRRFDEMKLANGDLVEVDAGHAKFVAPAYRHAGMHQDVVALPLGLGRTVCGPIGEDVGPNAFPIGKIENGRLITAALPVTLRRAEGNEPLALAQGSDVIDRARRPLVPTTTLTAFEAKADAGTEQEEGGPSAWPEHEYAKARWGMAIDLSKCIGCGKCVVGCQAENNIPIVGKRGMLDGREMSWLRIDRYYDAPAKDGGWDAEVWDGPLEVVEEPQTLFEPMLCQHCENAPCETVCPFSATMHSEDGLNQQIYNRCVGTRYCANNCPFKVRRFNYWELSKRQDSSFFRWLVPRIAKNAELNTREPMQMKNNPEVTVRSRGVMEKCSFCVQRIRGARAEATRNGGNPDQLADGAVVTACMEACPTNAITFGNVNAPDSKVAALAASPRAMKLLESTGVTPSISYLTKVRNDQA